MWFFFLLFYFLPVMAHGHYFPHLFINRNNAKAPFLYANESNHPPRGCVLMVSLSSHPSLQPKWLGLAIPRLTSYTSDMAFFGVIYCGSWSHCYEKESFWKSYSWENNQQPYEYPRLLFHFICIYFFQIDIAATTCPQPVICRYILKSLQDRLTPM